MSVSYHAPASVNTPHLRLIRDEEDVPYDTAPPRREPFTMMPRWVLEEHGADLGLLGWGVLSALAHHADDHGRCFPSTSRIAKLLGVHRVSVSDAIPKLVAKGLVVVEERRTETGARTSNAYVLPFLSLSPTATGVQSTATAPVVLDDSPCSPGLHKREPVNETQKNENGGYPPTPRKRTGPAYSEEFEEFWRAYPKGGGNKVKAFDQWRRLRPDDNLRGEIMAGLVDWKLCDRWRRGFVKAADIWLRDRWWEDEPPREAQANLNGHTIRNGKDIGWSNEQIDAYLAEAEAQGLIPQQRGPR